MTYITMQIRNKLLNLMAQQGLTSAISIYHLLEKQGLRYATLAKGIAKGNTAIGLVTNVYLQLIARYKLHKIINNQANADIPLDNIKIAMAHAYAQFIIQQFDQQDSNVCIIKEITLSTVRTLHTKVFNDFGLGTEVWILAIPFKLLDNLISIRNYLLKIVTIHNNQT